MLYEVSETFHSLQGEGYWSGTPSFFIRLAGCNLVCPWCDTDHQRRETLAIPALFARAEKESPRCKRLVLTGGEPTLQTIQPLIDYFRERGWYVAVETNGTGGRPCADWVTVSPKAGVDYPEDLAGDEIKIVLDGKNDPGRFLHCAFKHWYIQPCSQDFEPAVRYVMEHPPWRLSVQLQFVLGIR
jgi:organic radical activating enzyme